MSNGILVRDMNPQAPVVEKDDSELETANEETHSKKKGGEILSDCKLETTDDETIFMIKEKHQNNHRLTKDEKISVNQTNVSVYWQYLKAVGLLKGGICFLLLCVQQVLVIGTMYWLALWVDDIATDVETFSTHQRLIVYASFIIGQIVLVCAGSVLLELAAVKAAQKLHTDMLSSVLSSPMSFFDVIPSGRILNRFTMDVNETDILLPDLMLKFLTGVSMLLFNIIAVSFKVPLYVILIALATVCVIILQRMFSKSSQQLKRIESATKSPLYSHFSETVAGAHVIRAQGEFARFQRKVVDLIDTNNAVFNVKSLAIYWMNIRQICIGILFVFLVCVVLVVLKGEIGAGMTGYIIANAYWVYAILPLVVFNGTGFESSIVCVERITEYTHLETEGNVSRTKPVPVNWPSEGKISFQRYFTRYRQGLDFVLEDVTFEIKPQEKVGVVGRTGSGKSSLTLALFRIIEAASGHIFIDDQNIAEIDLSVLRSRLTIIPQDPVLFSGTLRVNLDPFDQHEDEELWSALEHAHLKQFAKSLNDGLQHNIVEGGQNLSVGQRQLVCLTRALLRKSKILVLDEATASVDYETDELIQKTIRKEFWDCTIITIAHRLNTIMDYDRVMVLDHGTLMEFDSPPILLKNERSLFFGLAQDAGIVQ